jgi:uncharacterized protein (TIGR03435 family)
MRSHRLAAVVTAAATVFTCAQVPTGSTAAPATQFEVASVKMVDSRPHPVEDLVKGIGATSMNSYPTSRVALHNASMKLLLNIAYQTDQRYIEGAPGWSDTQLYDVDAKVEGDDQLTYSEMKPLLQGLLEQRFHLQVHRITKPVSGYAMVVANGGPKLQTAAHQASNRYAQMMSNRVDAWSVSADTFAGILSHPVGDPVIDKTGLTGVYDITLKFAPMTDPNSLLPSIFTAVQEQLGLKLQPQKVPTNFLVIDHVDREPTEN